MLCTCCRCLGTEFRDLFSAAGWMEGQRREFDQWQRLFLSANHAADLRTWGKEHPKIWRGVFVILTCRNWCLGKKYSCHNWGKVRQWETLSPHRSTFADLSILLCLVMSTGKQSPKMWRMKIPSPLDSVTLFGLCSPHDEGTTSLLNIYNSLPNDTA
jgi:hypothetical protein